MQTLNTRVVSCEPSKNGEAECYEAVLEDTILFPEGGGQVLRARLVLRNDVTTFVIPCRPTTVARYSELLESIYIPKGETCMIDAACHADKRSGCPEGDTEGIQSRTLGKISAPGG